MKHSRLSIIVVVCLLGFWVGCQETQTAGTVSPEAVRRAQLVGHENIQLKQVIADKDAEIADLKRALAAAQAENARIEQQHGETYTKLLQIVAECQRKLEHYEKADQE